MLGKLMKYEIEATQRIFLPLYGLIVIFALINKAFISFNLQKMTGVAALPFVISMLIYCVLIAALFVMTLVVTIQRFQKNLLADEGYLSFTLPVKAHCHLDSKMLVTLMWTVLSLIVAVLSVFLLTITKENVRDFSNFCMQVGIFFNKNGPLSYVVFIEAIVLMLVGATASILQIYAAITVGNLSSKHKLLAGIGAYIGFGVVEQIVASVIINAGIGFRDLDAFFSRVNPFQVAAGGMGIMIAYSLIFGAAFYFFTNWMLSRKLNLE